MKDKILELRKNGLSYNEISRRLNCSKGTISYHCSKLEFNKERINKNLEIKNKKQIKIKSFLLETPKIDEVIELRKVKISYKEICKITGLSKHIISKICREFNLVNERKIYGIGKISDEEVKNIILLYDELKSIRAVSRKLNLSRNIINKYINLTKAPKLTSVEAKNRKIKNVIDWRKRKKVELIEYKGGCCEKCGYNKCIEAMEFHHIDPMEKDFTISGKSWSFERLKSEVDKCVLLCSNCHKETHFEDKRNKKQRCLIDSK